MSLLVIGTLAYDTIETIHTRRIDVLGGSAMYFSIAAGMFVPVQLVAVVGRDFRPQDLELLKKSNIDTSGVEHADGRTFRWSGRYESDWNTRHTLETQLNVFEKFEPKVPTAMRAATWVFLANAAPKVQMRALDQVTKPKFTVVDTMNLWIDTARADLLHLLRRVDAVVLNDEEARMLTGERNLIKAAGAVLGLGPRYVILKKGEHGAFLLGKDVHFSLPAYPIGDVVDPTGAGDSFAGGFMGHIAEQGNVNPETLRQAMLYGTVSASWCVQGFGIEALAGRTRREIDARYDDLRAICTVP
ncbi:MAG: PfkB family carbohydrate kinase [Planctomycetota bacterium]|nr:PfkB family carbohydrate kinase [Planctomycetota bacterium]